VSTSGVEKIGFIAQAWVAARGRKRMAAGVVSSPWRRPGREG
jgi:hypothetical protein